MDNKKQIIIPLVLMIIIASSFISNSTLENVRAVDIVQLVVFGALLGIMVTGIKAKFWKK